MNTLVEPLAMVGARRTLPDMLQARAARNGDAPLFSDRVTSWTARDAVQAASGAPARWPRMESDAETVSRSCAGTE